MVIYDFDDRERELIKQYADEDNRTISVWIADAVRAVLKGRQRVDAHKGKA